ncbi:4-hydroxy-3-polyprenylbenzoate decarboxylase [Rhodopseudomonas thermotolerans]|uniref:Flavin prenyltransferase UbiX n=2 Tax=Rhodopseudomonas TaxID=1073 RepID=A0A336JSD3_9BRAD|nr:MULTISPECIES: UbiX family flavin prenyltransferase [Rhodopseudomonas]RED31951.1 4-hydroxy-3-polyprenylbenzoate decarboxylase [Rhodopseudomonas pentothenatexigens]REF93332.1 4-hydroxy-3-polyprenylbenzoate decarboxylase [Rhodopseudomonas thermotolerans]SSW91623.1 4-hydroxy-3-polyprenylbenzoate decarboxylase [Rhodopseudomonas pentothenatexigens]
MSARHRIAVGISGASGAAVGLRVVELLASVDCELHLVVSKAARRTIAYEAGPNALDHAIDLVHRHHEIDDVGACIASGSFRTSGMIVAPCSIRTLSAIAHGDLDNLLVRAADVQLKERRRLVLMLRETPLHLGHIRSMAQATEIGAIVAPLSPAFYQRPRSISEMVDHMALRAIGLLGLHDLELAAPEWSDDTPPTCPKN